MICCMPTIFLFQKLTMDLLLLLICCFFPGNLDQRSNSITITERIYAGVPHFVIKTPQLTYYYDRQGGGFSRIIDPAGNDWVSFKREPWGQYPASAASSFSDRSPSAVSISKPWLPE